MGPTFAYEDASPAVRTFAYVIEGSGGVRVLKWHAWKDDGFRAAAEATARLRSRGYPAPHYEFVGGSASFSYAVLEVLPGTPLGHLTPELVERIGGLNARQAGAASGPGYWPARITRPVLEGGDGYCIIETMRSHSAETSRVLDAVQESTCAGDRGFDLATLLFYCYEASDVREPLREMLLDISGDEASRVYLAHMIFRQVEWSIRFHSAGIVDHYLEIARSILKDFT